MSSKPRSIAEAVPAEACGKRDDERRQDPLAMRHIPVLVAILAAFAVDQISKVLALALLGPGMEVAVLPGLSLTLGFNEGVSFGILSGTMAGRPLVLAAATGALTAWFAFVALRSTNRWERLGFGLIVGGSLGNIADRVRQGAVTDFLDLNWGDWRWPTFNIADVAIVVGAGAVLASLLLAGRSDAKTVPVSGGTSVPTTGRSDLPSS